MPENQKSENDQQKVQVHVSPDLDYAYRDMVNIFVGTGDVVFEFGNHHRSMPGNITVSNRIVMTYANAFDLQQKLQQVLMEAQKQMAQQMQQQQATHKTSQE
ncbi:MAG: hypothetical protein L3J98_07440 [Gammaproteobacteria bacterium]|nr:hypothetical protein [Gammaproteobacteria bacterium]MCF6259980.1 hypothetical protein [Gammaproteobacteria bacterium]